ncbi:hypothetical protein DSO57_1023168 [Entomophthora muscae]|uniref:Uncharacterized protein n=1 Tax=Entomophthora muscae TaxID=34485 RepID=A0ACC2TQA9_9FUNG|nr:hypothetical protein DSO57_1023168 [Entomophthora muscae]
MNLKSTPVANQELSLGRGTGTGLRPNPMTTTLKQVNQNSWAKCHFAAFGPKHPVPQACLSQCPDEPPMENIMFGGGLIQLLPHFVFAFYQISTRSHSPPSPLPSVSCPPGVSCRPVHFTKYPFKPKYKDYTPEKKLKLNSLACMQSAVKYNCQGPWIFSTPKLFRGKLNYLPAYNIHMELPVTPKPMPASLPDLPTDHTGKIFGIVYITLTGVIDTIISATSPWSWVKKSVSYPFKLAPLLWWALPAKTLAQVTPENNRLAAQDLIPDTKGGEEKGVGLGVMDRTGSRAVRLRLSQLKLLTTFSLVVRISWERPGMSSSKCMN